MYKYKLSFYRNSWIKNRFYSIETTKKKIRTVYKSEGVRPHSKSPWSTWIRRWCAVNFKIGVPSTKKIKMAGILDSDAYVLRLNLNKVMPFVFYGKDN